MSRARDLARLIVNSSGALDSSNLTNAVPADGSITSAKLASGAAKANLGLSTWSFTESAGVLYLTNGTNRFKIDASGNVTVSADLIAYGTV